MSRDNKKRMRITEELRLPELQARFHDIVGEATRSPNKKFLLRRIAEALEAQEQEAVETASAVDETEPTTSEPTTANGEPKLTKLSVEELQRHEDFGQNCGLCLPYVRHMLRSGTTVFRRILTGDEGGP